MPDRWRFKCLPTLETGSSPCKKHTTTTGRHVSNSESGEPDDRPLLLWHNSHGNAFSVEDITPGGERWDLCLDLAPNQERLSVTQLHTNSHGVFAWQSVTLHLILSTQLNSTLRCRGIPPCSRRGGCQLFLTAHAQSAVSVSPRRLNCDPSTDETIR